MSCKLFGIFKRNDPRCNKPGDELPEIDMTHEPIEELPEGEVNYEDYTQQESVGRV